MLKIGYVNLYVSLGFIVIYAIFIGIVLYQSKTVKTEDKNKEDEYTKKASQMISVLTVVGQTQTQMRGTMYSKSSSLKSTVYQKQVTLRSQKTLNDSEHSQDSTKQKKAVAIIEEVVEDEENNEQEGLGEGLIANYQTQKSVKNTFRLANNNKDGGSQIISEDYIQGLIAQRTLAIVQQNAEQAAFAGNAISNQQPRDRMYLGNKMRALLKRTSENGLQDNVTQIVAIPLNFIRDYTIPTSDMETWNRNRNSIIPITLIPSFMFLFEMYKDDPDAKEGHESDSA